ncbi:MAG: ABC transporter substrate-binding protein [Thaumarchaeota archaeon]|nr:ABC transporter substrate-binding protein [Nitrososphaerota archaeon]
MVTYPGRNRHAISRIGIVIVVIVLVVVGGVGAYLYLRPEAPAGPGSTIKIGMTLSQSGTFASLDGNYTKFNTAWQNWVNTNGGLKDSRGVGHNVSIVWYDDQSQHDLAVSQYQKLAVQDNVTVLVSPYSADIGKDLIPQVAQADKVPIIMAEASTASMWVASNPHDWAVTSMVPYWAADYTTGWSGQYFSMLKSQIASSPSTAPKTIALVGWDITWAVDDYSSSLQLAPQAGLQVVYQNKIQPSFTDPVAGFSAIIPALKAANPDIIYLATFGPVAALWMKAAAQAGLQPKQWHTIEWGSAFSFLAGGSASVNHVTSDVFWTPTYLSKNGGGFSDESTFSQLLQTAYGSAQSGWYQFQNVELRMVIFQMIKAAVAATDNPTRANLNTALHALNIATVSGQLNVQPQGYGTIGLVPVQWQNNRIQTVFPASLSNMTYAYP